MKNMAKKYACDPTYRQLVDTMEHMIHSHQFTPSEMREMAVLASIHYEMKNPSPMILYINKEDMPKFKELYHGTWAIECGACGGHDNLYGKFRNKELKEDAYLCSTCAKTATQNGYKRID